VDSGRATISWTLPPHSPVATGYVLEAGTASGLSNIATLTLGSATSLAVPAVPPGRYYVRVRATNYTGTGAASNEVVIDVP
jgi:predicted nicotinamide N-methyase